MKSKPRTSIHRFFKQLEFYPNFEVFVVNIVSLGYDTILVKILLQCPWIDVYIFLMVNVDLGSVIQQELSDTLIWIWFGIMQGSVS